MKKSNKVNDMDNNKQLIEKYRTVQYIKDIILVTNALSVLGFVSSFLLWLITFNSSPHTLHESSGILWIVELTISICLIILGVWLLKKEKSLKEKLGIKDDETNKDVQT